MGGNGRCGYEGSFVLHLERGRVHGRSQCESLVPFRDHTHQLRCRHTHCQPAGVCNNNNRKYRKIRNVLLNLFVGYFYF